MSELSDIKDLNGEERLLHRDYTEDLEAHDKAIVDYDAYEAMDMGKTYDPISKQTNNGLTDNMTSTIYLERAARVAGQLPEGETRAFGKKDYGKGLFLDILRKNWIYPNANAQFDFLTKMYMWQYGSSEYNYMPMYVDLNVSPTGYFGPDCWLWNPRNFIPQSGLTSITEMDYVHAIAYKTFSWFEDMVDSYEEDDDDEDDFDIPAIKSILAQLKNATKNTDPKRDTLGYRERMTQSTRQIAVVTRYESGDGGRWITFLPDFGCKVIRNIANPHKNGRIPFVIKRCIPKFDSFYGNGDFQRSMPMQFANDGLDNFYFQGIRVNLFPATMINMQTAVRHTITPEPGAVWEFNGTPDAKRYETSTAGLSTYQAAKGMSRGAIQSIAGTTDTRSNAENAMDPGMGKTPEALQMIGEREDTRDAQDRRNLESAMTELIDLMYSILPTIAEDIPVDMFSDEIEEILSSGYDDLDQIFVHMKENGNASFRMSESGNQLRIKIKPSAFERITPRFRLKPNSTAVKTKEAQLKGLKEFLDMLTSLPNALDQYQAQTGKAPDWEYIFAEAGKLADLPFMAKMFTTVGAPQNATPAGQETLPTPGIPGGQPAMPVPGAVPPVQPAMPPVAPVAPAPMPAPLPAPVPVEPQIPPEVLAASPEAPVVIAGYNFTNPQLAAEAYQAVMMVRR